MIVAPILIHLALTYHLSLYSGTNFNADLEKGLTGTIDHLFSQAAPQQSAICPPITTVVETKSDYGGISHCLVQMVAAQQLNRNPGVIYGVVTTGILWRFLKLEEDIVTLDLTDYLLFPLEQLLASLMPIAG